jgi:hypothetical protein
VNLPGEVKVCEQVVGTLAVPQKGSAPSPVTVWNPPEFDQVTVSPTRMVMSFGEKAKFPKLTVVLAAWSGREARTAKARSQARER